MIKNSFSIENILSKPHKNLSLDNQCKSDSATECSESNNSFEEVSSFTSHEITPKHEPINGLVNDDAKIDRNNFTSPDSSGCEEDNGDNLSDITTGDNRKCQFNFLIEIDFHSDLV